MAQVNSLTIAGKDFLDIIYPVGSIYQTSLSGFDPNTEWGGTWERIKGKVLVGVDEDDTDFTNSCKTGGEKTHKLTIAEMPKHGHSIIELFYDQSVSYQTDYHVAADKYSKNYRDAGSRHSAQYAGSDNPHNNMPPYFTCYIWRRTS